MSSKKRQGHFFYIVKIYTAKGKKCLSPLMTCLRIVGRSHLNGDFSFGFYKLLSIRVISFIDIKNKRRRLPKPKVARALKGRLKGETKK